MEKNTNVERAGDLNSALAEVTADNDAIFDAAFEKWKVAYWDIVFDRAWFATCQECEGEDLGFTHTCHSGLPWTVPPGEPGEDWAGQCEDDTKDGSSRVCKDCFDKILEKAIDVEIDAEMDNSFQAFYDWAADHADDKPCSCKEPG